MSWIDYAKATECDPFTCVATVVDTSGVMLRIDRHIQATSISATIYAGGTELTFASSIFDAPPKMGEQVQLEWSGSNWRATRIESSDNQPTD